MYHATVIEIRRGTAHGKGSVAAVRPAPVAVRVMSGHRGHVVARPPVVTSLRPISS